MTGLTVYTDSNQGPRESLEDAALSLVLWSGDPHQQQVGILGVFDGVGGNLAGEIASTKARDVFSSQAAALSKAIVGHEPDSEHVAAWLQQVLGNANDDILQMHDERAEWRGMATTAVCAAIVDHTVVIAWCGDSRACLIRDGELTRLTRDHSVVENLIMLGLISRREAVHHPRRHEITQYLGMPSLQRFATTSVQLQPGDAVLLCSDGLTDVIPDFEIAEIITARDRHAAQDGDVAHTLVDAAIEAGSTDNVTAVVAYCGLPAPLAETSTHGYPTHAARAAAQRMKSLQGTDI